MAKGDPRAAAERLEKGIERYGDGDLVAAAVEFEEALRLSPEHPRARQYLSWVKDVLAGTRGNGKKKDLDEDAVRAVTEALDSDHEVVRPEDSPWDPVPLMPSPSAERALPSDAGIPNIPYPMDAVAGTEPPPPAEPRSTTPSSPILSALLPENPPPPVEAAPQRTMLGLAPQRGGILTPLPKPAPVEDRPESVTKEFQRGTPTLQNLPPLDVPELTEDQVAELISLESSLPTTSPAGRPLTADLAATPDLPTERKAFMEFDADPTPMPRPVPGLEPLGPPELDPLESEPTRARLGPQPSSSINPLPVDERFDLRAPPDEDEDGAGEVTQNPTNPFIRGKLAEYAYTHGVTPLDGELPPPIDAGAPVAERFAAARRLLSEGEARAALDLADSAVTESGGVDGEGCLPYLSVLEKIYETLIGPFERVPQHGGAVPDLDPRAAFLLSRLDGNMSVDDLLDVSGMPRLEAMRVLALLIRHGAVITK